MIRFAQILSGIFVIILGGAGLATIFFPLTILEPTGFDVISKYGITNVRTLGAPTLSLAFITAIAVFLKDWLLLLPASMYFLFNFLSRLISVFIEGYEPVMLHGLLTTMILFVLSQVSLHIFLNHKKNSML